MATAADWLPCPGNAAPRESIMRAYLNWQGETVDELARADFAPDRDGFKAFRAEVRRLCAEYAMAGMDVYESTRACKGWNA